MMVLLQVFLMWAYLGEVMDEQRDSATSTVTILPLKAAAIILLLSTSIRLQHAAFGLLPDAF